jgi:agmatinase
MRRIWDLLGDGRIWQFGIRSGTREEFAFAKAGHTHFYPFDLSAMPLAADKLKGKNIYLTIDLDVLDSSVFPGTGTPEAGGVSFSTLLEGLLTQKSVNIIGADMVELSPHYDASGSSTALACKLLRELLLLLSDFYECFDR